jgi:hypothetical protein
MGFILAAADGGMLEVTSLESMPAKGNDAKIYGIS